MSEYTDPKVEKLLGKMPTFSQLAGKDEPRSKVPRPKEMMPDDPDKLLAFHMKREAMHRRRGF